MTLSRKLYFTFSAAFFISLIIGASAIYNLGGMGESVDGIVHVSARNLYVSAELSSSGMGYVGSVRAMILRGYMNYPDEVRMYYNEAQHNLEQLKQADAEFIKLTTQPDLRAIAQEQIGDKIATLSQVTTEAYEAIEKGDVKAAGALCHEKITPMGESLSEALNQLSQKESKQVTERGDTAVALVSPARTLSFVMMAVSLGVGIVGVWVVRTINATLAGSVTELGDGADQVANAASQVSSSSQSLAQGASEQAASLEETSASSEEINSMARKNTDNSKSTAELLSQSQRKVNQANQYLRDMVASMDQITDSSGKISKIIKVIDEIAFQTNILALNAAVEAARAGEAGMGFAVVAD